MRTTPPTTPPAMAPAREVLLVAAVTGRTVFEEVVELVLLVLVPVPVLATVDVSAEEEDDEGVERQEVSVPFVTKNWGDVATQSSPIATSTYQPAGMVTVGHVHV